MDDIIANIAERERQLFDQLAACPLIEITGVVSASGVGAGKSHGQELWSLLMSFDAWRIGPGPLRTESLTIRRKVSDEELRTFQEIIDADTVIKIRARLAEVNVFGCPQALLEEFIQIDSSDSELHDYLAELQKPVTHEDDFFGTFTLDRRVHWYSVRVHWSGKTVDLHLSVEEHDDIDSALKVAHALWGDESSWNERVRDYAVQELLPLKNENWLDEDETELTPEQFKSKMTLESIAVYPDGSFEFWHDDGDLFWGHSIQVCGNLSEGLTGADIPG
jgi:hypothetical protein